MGYFGSVSPRPQHEEVGVTKDIKSNLEIPIEVRQLAEKGVGEAKRAFDNFVAAAQKVTNSMEGQAAAVQSGSKEMHSKIRTFAERNVATCFEFAQKFIHAKNMQEVMQLQAELVKAQMQAITEQTTELANAAVKSVMDAAKPKT
jgi:phasin